MPVGQPNAQPSSDGPLRDDQLAQLAELSVPVVADVLDRLGYRHQAMSSQLRPVAAPRRIVGPAFPVQAVARAALPDNPYEKEIEATDAVPRGSIIVFNAGGVTEAGVWGELLATRAVGRGCAGAVIDGGVRDLAGIEQLDFPTFATAVHPADSYGRAEVISFGLPIVCGGVPVRQGDVVVADVDGVVVIPYEVAGKVLMGAVDKRSKERAAQEMLDAGASVRATYERHQVL
jgi:4-hydroxy-4-methyl-2-oxoglutarate aldolase